MSEKAVMNRLRNANPVHVTPVDAPDVWLEIIVSPGDPGLDVGLDNRWREAAGAGTPAFGAAHCSPAASSSQPAGAPPWQR